MGKEVDLKTAIVVGSKFRAYIAEVAVETGLEDAEVLKRAIAMYRTIKRMEKEGYTPCMVKDRTARVLVEEE